MPILVVATIKLSQNTMSFSQTIGVIDRDQTVGYRFNESFSYLTPLDLEVEWDYNASANVFLNLTAGWINFTTDTLLGGEGMYFRHEFNTISALHNDLLVATCDVLVINASLTAFAATSLGMMIGEDVLLAVGVNFMYGNITAVNGSASEVIQSVENNSLYHLETTVFLENQTYEVRVNGTPSGIFDFALNITTLNAYQSYVYPSGDPFASINLLLDNVNVTVDATVDLDLSANLSAYFADDAEVIYYTSEEDAHDDLATRKIGGIVVIPDGFETNITQDFPVVLNVTTDGTNRHDSPEIIEKINAGIVKFREEHEYVLDFIVTEIESDFTDSIAAGPVWMGLLIPPVIGIAFVASSMITTCECIVDDIPLRRLLLSPMKKSEVIVAKFCAYLFFSVSQTTLFMSIWLVALPALGWQQGFVGSILDCFLITLLMSVVGIGFGFTISAIAKTKAQANQGFVTVYVILLVIWMLRITDIDPFSLGEIAYIGVIFKGQPLTELLDSVLLLLLYGGVTVGLSFVIFSIKKSLV